MDPPLLTKHMTSKLTLVVISRGSNVRVVNPNPMLAPLNGILTTLALSPNLTSHYLATNTLFVRKTYAMKGHVGSTGHLVQAATQVVFLQPKLSLSLPPMARKSCLLKVLLLGAALTV